MGMRGLVSCLALGLAVLVAGCTVEVPVEVRFTSADAGGGSREFLDVPGMEEEGVGEGAGDREVVEPDVIRRAGNLLYILNQHRGLSIVDLETETLLSQTPTAGYPRDLYLRDGRAYVLVGFAASLLEEGGVLEISPGSLLHVLDVSDPGAPAALGRLQLAGDFVDSRLVGDVLYAVSAEFSWHFDGVEVAKQQTSETWVTSIDVGLPQAPAPVEELRFPGYGSIVHATDRALFSATPDWRGDRTDITYVDISDPTGRLAVRGTAEVPGHVADRFKMDVYEDVLRVVSNTGWQDRQTYVTTVDLRDPDAPAVLGQTTIPGAEGETLFATRFDGPRAFAVTFLMIDPLFVIDLSDPADPRVTGELKVPGWSTHIEVRGDRLVALGVDDTDGWRVSVSLFDVSDATAPGLVDRVTFGEGWSWSSALHDVKAFAVLDDLVLVPFGGWNEAGGYDRLQFVRFTEDSLEAAGHVDVDGQVIRSFSLGDRFYAVTAQEIAVIGGTAEAPVRDNTVILAEYVADYRPLGRDARVQVLRDFNTGSVAVRTVDGSGMTLGETRLPFPHLAEVHGHGDTLVLVGTGWEDGGYYEVATVDCGDPGAPALLAQERIGVGPWFGGFWRFGGGVLPDVDGPMLDRRPWWPWFGQGTGSSFVVGDYLVLRCVTERHDVVYGDGEAWQGLAVVSLRRLGLQGVAGLAWDAVPGMEVSGDRLYVSSFDRLGADVLGRNISAYFLSAFDPATLRMGPRANVPGQLVQYDADAGIAVLEDWQYRDRYQVARSMATVRWRGGTTAELVARVALDDQTGALVAGGSRVYFTTYGMEQAIGSVTVGPDGSLGQGGRVALGNHWAWLRAAEDDRAYVVYGDRALARFDFSGAPALDAYAETMSGPVSLHLDATGAYGALGYGGTVYLP